MACPVARASKNCSTSFGTPRKDLFGGNVMSSTCAAARLQVGDLQYVHIVATEPWINFRAVALAQIICFKQICTDMPSRKILHCSILRHACSTCMFLCTVMLPKPSKHVWPCGPSPLRFALILVPPFTSVLRKERYKCWTGLRDAILETDNQIWKYLLDLVMLHRPLRHLHPKCHPGIRSADRLLQFPYRVFLLNHPFPPSSSSPRHPSFSCHLHAKREKNLFFHGAGKNHGTVMYYDRATVQRQTKAMTSLQRGNCRFGRFDGIFVCLLAMLGLGFPGCIGG